MMRACSPSTMSVLGLYNYDNTLFNNMAYPTMFTTDDKTTFLNNLLMEVAELEVIYTDPSFMKFAIEAWSHKELPTWQRVYNASLLEYNPIENYNRTEETTIVDDGSDIHSGNDTSRNSGSDSNTGGGSLTRQNDTTGYDSNAFVPREKITDTTTDTNTTTYGGVNTFTHGEQIARDNERTITGNISGNIGVTTSQQMLEQEIEIAGKLNIYNLISDSFKNRFCLQVY